MFIIAKLLAAAVIAIGILSPTVHGGRFGLPKAETCECKAKAGGVDHSILPRADSCECKVKEH